MNTIDLKHSYEVEFAKLNPKQKEAVETVEGPVMVIAGPGTGKTQILSRRVANILLNHNANPEDIVCLTYTEAGASEMLDRLENLLGESGRNVRVSTIHAFCSGLILANPDYFENQPKVISTAAQYEILKEIMDEHIQEGDVLYKNSGYRYSSKGPLLDLFSRMKRNNFNEDTLKNEITSYVEQMKTSRGEGEFHGLGYKKSDKLTAKGEALKTRLEKSIAGARLNEIYMEKLAEKNYFDFDDMILWVKALLEENTAFQQLVSASIKYLFVDEFQDSSVLQNELIDLLVAGQENPNIFVVGDDDQSIYRFQGVSATNIEDFSKKYHPTEIVLEENYRSSQVIIDAAKELIQNNPRKDKQLQAAGANKDYLQKAPTLTKYETDAAEMRGVLNDVKELIAHGVAPKEIGIIYGRNNYGKKLAKLFRQQGIPVHIKIDDDLFADAFFIKLYSMLKYLNRPTASMSDFRKLLYFDFFNVSLEELVNIRDVKTKEDLSSPDILTIYKELETLRQKILRAKQPLSPVYILQQIIKICHIDTYLMQSSDKYHLVSVLTTLYELMQLTPEISLAEFLGRITGLQEMKVALPIKRLETSPDNCVNLMTAHGSKGLEFDHVFMIKCNDGTKKDERWPGKENHSSSFTYPPSLSDKKDNETELKEQENRRLFYVAMTRAKKELNISYSNTGTHTHFIDEFKDYLVERTAVPVTEEMSNQVEISLPALTDQVRETITSNFSLSVSTLNSFLKCPLSFYFNKGLRFSTESNEALVFGNIIHSTLESIYVSDGDDLSDLSPKTIRSKDETLKYFEEIFERESHQLPSKRARQDDYKRGISIINNFYQASDYLKSGHVAIEKNIAHIKLGNIKNTSVDLTEVADFEINGKIDKLEIDGDVIRVIDYKTGNPTNATKKLSAPSEKSPQGEDYWRQAVFYYILLTHSDIDVTGKEIQVRYVFVENEKDSRGFSEKDCSISEQDMDFLLEQIKTTLLEMKAGDFTTGCGILEDGNNGIYPCEYCTQARLNMQPLDNREAVELASYDQAVKSFKTLSVSNLNRYRHCSNSFYFDHVLKLTTVAGLKPAAKEYASKIAAKHAPTGHVFGTVMHETLEHIYRDHLDLAAAIGVFDESLSRHESNIIDTMNASDMKKYGHQLLNNLFDTYIPNSCKDVELEKEIQVTLEDNLQINGIIDKLEFDGDIIRVVDYKTGSAQHGVEELETGGDYWRQAVYYNILLEESTAIDTGGKTIETRYIFLDDDRQETGYSIHDLTVTSEDIEIVKQDIKDFWQAIRKGQFKNGCQKDDCDFCKLGCYVDFDLISSNRSN
ncbi:ATP-dependent DNA helicase [Streptococcus sp. sy010]|uniref:ATP-dependent DNA helicase n=1 Tax=Streptococcus sp. sy010 TaxID=2600148 RepID=UPI0011B82884|nr:ATP-dependent DNA helicase [Streptococcus sp. sy010]TWT16493.1 ATP-dependent helicase [Streptococcus sp. sy010]